MSTSSRFCDHCDGEYAPKARHQKYCCDDCRYAANELRKTGGLRMAKVTGSYPRRDGKVTLVIVAGRSAASEFFPGDEIAYRPGKQSEEN